jgi:ATPase family AAA domain-containing protein 2
MVAHVSPRGRSHKSARAGGLPRPITGLFAHTSRALSGLRADIDPVQIEDSGTGFSQVGGLDAHIQKLKEMIVLPLKYPEVFAELGISPPRGVLFWGPPGTGKTLVARELARACSPAGSSEGRGVTFFMRNGADVLSKWVGEAERQLRLLFDEAKKNQPSIIFFDEIDGLAPVRSAKQDHIHSSIVSTLLSLMDGVERCVQTTVHKFHAALLC